MNKEAEEKLLAAVEIHKSEQFADAADAYAAWLREYGENGRVLSMRAAALLAAGKHTEAAEPAQRGVLLAPEAALSHFIFGRALDANGRGKDAAAAYRAALAIDPNSQDAVGIMVSNAEKWKRYHEATEWAIKFAQMRPDDAAAQVGAAGLLHWQGWLIEAAAYAEKAIKLEPHRYRAHRQRCISLLGTAGLSGQQIRAAHDQLGAVITAQAGQKIRTAWKNTPLVGRKLRIGYLSGEFVHSPMMYFLSGVLQAHDKDNFEIHAYANVPWQDSATQLVESLVDRFTLIREKNDDDVADMIEADGIDVLVELGGYTSHGRPGVSARKPAPVVVSYLGYPATNGLASVTHRIGDTLADPPEQDDHWMEKIVRIDTGFLGYTPPHPVPNVHPAPHEEAGIFTYGIVNNLAKTNDRQLVLANEILKRTPGSRLVMKAEPLTDEGTRAMLSGRLSKLGFDLNRVVFAGYQEKPADHYGAIGTVDVALDTFPYNGTTTTCECLWMGVPVVAMIGNTHHARMTYAILSRIGLGDLAAQTEEQYVTIATSLFENKEHLKQIRTTLRSKMTSSPLMDTTALAKNLETVYQNLYQQLVTSG